jgi:hypothetical protein
MLRSTLHNQTNSPLLRLPSELRNRVYEYALGGDCEPFTIKASPIDFPMTLLDLPALSLLRSCRQIYHETANLPYTLIKSKFSDSTSISKFVDQRTPAQLQAIRHLVLDTY